MNPRRPRPSRTTSTLPTFQMVLATSLAACTRAGSSPPTTAQNPQPTGNVTTPGNPPQVTIGPGDPVPPVLGGAPMMVTPEPPSQPTPAPAPAPQSAPAPSAPAPAAAAGAAAEAPAVASARAVTIVHRHPPGTPCNPLTEAQVRAAQRGM